MKRILCFILMVLLIIGVVPIIGFAEYGSLFISSPKTITAKSGETIKVPVEVENISNDPIDDIVVKVDIESPDSVYLVGSSFKTINYIDGKDSKKVRFEVEIDPAAKKGSYKINVDVSSYDGGSTSDTIYIRVDSKPPKLNISRLDIIPNSTVGIGEEFNLGIELENLGDIIAEDIRVSLDGLSEEGISLSQGSGIQNIQSIPAGLKNFAVFQLKTSKKIAPGSHQLKLKLKYNETDEDSLDVFINVSANREKAAELIFENLLYPSDTVGQNQEVVVSFDLTNLGQSEAKNIIIKAESKDMEGLVPKSVSQLKIDSIAPEDTENVEFKFLTTKNAATKNYPMEINIEYEDDIIADGEKYSLNQFVGFFISGDEENQSKPKLIIDKYNFEPNLVKAGENFTMNLSFFNTNSSKAVKNIKIFLTSNEKTNTESNSAGGSVFTPVNSSNTFYIESIPPKGRVEKKITMFTVPDAQAKTYTLTANFEYEDTKEEYTAEELIGVPVIQSSKLDIGELSVLPESYIGESTPISLEFYNTGKVTLYNMMVKLEGDFQTENGQYYVGNFASGESEFFEGYVIPSAPGELNGAVIFTYEDSTGQEQEIKKEFTLNVMDAPPMPDFPEGMPPEEAKQGGIKGILKSKIFWGVIALLAVGAAGTLVYKKRKKMKEMEIDE